MSDGGALERMVQAEIGGKYLAVHAYDRMLWTIRSGFVTLFFAGWGLLLRGIIEHPFGKVGDGLSNEAKEILFVIVLTTVALGFVGLLLDQNYARRKFRVIYALDRLMGVMLAKAGQPPDPQELAEFVQVSGDKQNNTYRLVSGYRPAWWMAFWIYFTPVLLSGASTVILWT